MRLFLTSLAAVLLVASVLTGPLATATPTAAPTTAPAATPASAPTSAPTTAPTAASPAAPERPGARQDGGRLGWPLVEPHRVTRPFVAPSTPYGPGHRGVDLAAEPGRQVFAAGAGVVVYAGVVAGVPVVSIDHDGGLRSTYEPVVASVGAGAQVHQGQPIGALLAGHPGCAVAACLHWGVLLDGRYTDPMQYLGTSRIRLKPWAGGG